MEKLQFFLLFAFTIYAGTNASNAQNYKQPLPSIDAKGKIADAQGKHIGWMTHDGLINDATGVKIGHIDSQGNLIDAKTGKVLGKAVKNGNYVYHVKHGSGDSLTISAPMNGICEVKNKDGKAVLLVHENYKQYGACALHCLKMSSEHKEMKMIKNN